MSVPTKSRDLSRHTIEEKIEAVRQRIFQESSFRTLRNRHGICNATLSGRKMLSGEFLKEVSRIRDNNE